MNRIDIIQALINKNGYDRYLEIGVQAGHCFTAIQVAHKVGVDPDPVSAATVNKTSDDYFAEAIAKGEKFDIIFIDGLHHADTVYRDIENALKCLAPGGVILGHDNLPTNEHMQRIPLDSSHVEWTGDTWKAFVKLRTQRDDLEMCVIDTDWGIAVIRPGQQQKLNAPTELDQLHYHDFVANKAHWMNVISVDEFKRRYL